MYDITREFVRNIYKNARISGIFVTNKGVITDKDLTLGMISEMKEDSDINTEWIKTNGKWKFLCVVHGISMFMEMKP